MSQVYHSNARTNQHIREIIQKSNLTNVELGDHCTTPKTHSLPILKFFKNIFHKL